MRGFFPTSAACVKCPPRKTGRHRWICGSEKSDWRAKRHPAAGRRRSSPRQIGHFTDSRSEPFFLGLADGAAALAHGVCFAVCTDTGMKRAGTISGLMLTVGSLVAAARPLAGDERLELAGARTRPRVDHEPPGLTRAEPGDG